MIPDNDDQREECQSENLVSLEDATGQVIIAVTDNIHQHKLYLSEKIVEKAAVLLLGCKIWEVSIEQLF